MTKVCSLRYFLATELSLIKGKAVGILEGCVEPEADQGTRETRRAPTLVREHPGQATEGCWTSKGD